MTMALLYVLFGFQLCLLLIFVFYRLAIVIKVGKIAANTKVYRNSLNTLYNVGFRVPENF